MHPNQHISGYNPLFKMIIAYVFANFHTKSKKTFAYFNFIYVLRFTIIYVKKSKEVFDI